MDVKQPWYQRDIPETVQGLAGDLNNGLNYSEIEGRRDTYGMNELREAAGRSVWGMLFAQFKDFLILLLLGAAIISALMGEVTDAAVIILVVVINALLGVGQEYRAEKSLEALKRLSAPMAKAVREGRIVSLPAKELVPGDLILLESGDFIPADLRLVETVNLKIDEAALTGESVPVGKSAAWIGLEDMGVADRKNSAFMGTVVTFGRGRGIVVTTGMDTEIGRIAEMIQATEPEETPLQMKLAEFGRQMGLLALGLCGVIFLVGVLRGLEVFQMFLTSVSLAVAAIPEGLPAIVTIVLALGVQRMAQKKAIIRKLPAVETLGAATVICSDKTGTLTQNAMTIRTIYTTGRLWSVTGDGFQPCGDFIGPDGQTDMGGEPALALLLKVGLLCNDAHLQEEAGEAGLNWRVVGDPTEGALLVAAAKGGFYREDLNIEFPRIMEFPFESVRKRMTTVHRGVLGHRFLDDLGSGTWGFTKGAPDVILEHCDLYMGPNGIHPLTSEDKADFLAINNQMASKAMRVLGFAVKPLGDPEKVTMADAENGLIFLGFMGMIDPPRPEAAEAIRLCREAGIRPVMITGDHRETAVAIGKELGLLGEGERVATGKELSTISSEEFDRSIKSIAVYARVSPEHKVKIVDGFRKQGDVVAMTGDGVNDAPALKRADIGAAMGISGTDVAKEAADMVLADDNFATVVAAVKEGRIVFENIKKAIYFLLSCNIGEILCIFVAILLGWAVPLLPIQILWVNLVTDSLPALALGVEPAEGDIMKRKPRQTGEGIFAFGTRQTLVVFGFYIGFITLLAFVLGERESLATGRTMAFATLSLSQLFHVFNFRSLRNSLLKRGASGNPYLVWAAIVSAALQIAVMVIPVLAKVFKVASLNWAGWLIILILSASTLAVGEIWKAIWIRRFTEQRSC